MLDSGLRDACASDRLRRRAGERSWERGVEYAAAGRVTGVVVEGTRVTATVAGGDRYRVRLSLDSGGELDGACTCPVGAEGRFCKHCVAVALSVGADDERVALREHLAALSHGELVELALQALQRDETLRARMTLAMRAGDRDELAAAIDETARAADFVAWGEAWDYAERLDAVLDVVERHGNRPEVVELAERFARVVEAELGNVDDSAGVVGDTIVRAWEIHRATCQATRPEPVGLAERLFALELRSDFVDDVLDRYREVLGPAGRERYRELAEAAWERSPGPQLQRIMERLAAGDVDRVVAIKARTLTFGWDYLEIARLLDAAGRAGEALEWAERGVAADPDPRLREFLATGYVALGRPEDALRHRAAHFADLPSLPAYRALRAAAELLGRWAECRAAALAGLDARHSDTRVAILLWEGDVAGAWEQALAGGCSREHWRALARERPGDAAAIYRRLLAPTIRLAGNGAYQEAVDLLSELHGLLAADGREAEHAALVAEVRAVHQRKRNLIKLLDAQAWACR